MDTNLQSAETLFPQDPFRVRDIISYDADGILFMLPAG